MTERLIKRYLLTLVLTLVGTTVFAQDNVPMGINYQAIARDYVGNELKDQRINVRFSIIAGDPLSTPVYQEVYQNVLTSRFGVFSLVIGHGVSTGSFKCKSLSDITWQTAPHSLKVEVQFEGENDFMDMGTMQFLAVPYALFAQKSLEPGPAGPKGDPGPQGAPGDPASDKQTLSVVNVDGSDYLAISGGNQVKLSTIDNQTLNLTGDVLSIARGNNVNLAPYKDNTDNQTLNLAGDVLSIAGGNSVNLSAYRDNTDNQQLTYSEATNSLSITNGGSVTLGTMVAFRAKKLVATSAPMPLSNVDFIPDNIEYNDGNGINSGTGEFTAANTGVYSFDIKYIAAGNGKMVMIYKNGNLYETLADGLTTGAIIFRTMTIKLIASDKIKMVINTGTDTTIGTGTFSGYKVY
jgi:hypothetical protein